MSKCKTVLLSTLLALSMLISHAEGGQDGNWWRGNSKHDKTIYILGFLDSRVEQTEIWEAALVRSLPKKFNPELVKFVSGIENDAIQNINMGGNVSVGQMSDGIDAFYNDFKNRLIPVRHAIRITNYSISGQSSEFIENMTVELRKKSSNN